MRFVSDASWDRLLSELTKLAWLYLLISALPLLLLIGGCVACWSVVNSATNEPARVSAPPSIPRTRTVTGEIQFNGVPSQQAAPSVKECERKFVRSLVWMDWVMTEMEADGLSTPQELRKIESDLREKVHREHDECLGRN